MPTDINFLPVKSPFAKRHPTKQLFLIRHAKSQAQAASKRERRTSTMLVDAKLASSSVDEMKELGRNLLQIPLMDKVEIVLCSPMSRAIQTACLIFQHTNTKILLVPDLSEFGLNRKMTGFENTGRPCETLLADKELHGLPKFKDVDFSLVRNFADMYGCQWWNSAFNWDKFRSQVERVKRYILEIPENVLAVVGHCCNVSFIIIVDLFT